MMLLMVAIAAVGGLLFGFETGVSAGVVRLAASHFGVSQLYYVLLGSGTLLGAVFGALASGRLADIVGRRDILMATAAIFALGAFVSAVAPTPSVLLLGRLVVGIGVGAVAVASPLYIAEIAPPRRRGVLVSMFQLMITAGILCAYIGHEAAAARPEAWRYIFAIGAVPGLLLSGLALLLIESPLWLALKGDEEEARASLSALGRSSDAALLELREAVAVATARSDDPGQLFAPANCRMLLVATAVFFFQQFVGINTIIYYSPDIFDRLGNGIGNGLGSGALILAAVNFAMTLVAMALIDRLGRRRLLVLSLVGSAAGLFLIAGSLSLSPHGERDLILAGFLLFIAFFAVGIGPIGWVVASEVCPVHMRGLAMSLPVAAHWVFDTVSSPTAFLVAGDIATPVVFGIYGLVAVVGLAVLPRILPETKGLSLAVIHKHFAAWAARGRKSLFVPTAIATIAATGGLLTGFNLAITAGTLVLITAEWNLSTVAQGTLVSSILVGLLAGSLLAGSLADRFGRRYLLMSTAALFVVGAFGCALAGSFEWLLVARFAVGFAIGIMAPTTGIYVAEIAPAAIRGRLLSLDAVTYAIGLLGAYGVSLAFEAWPGGWRYMFAVIAVPSAVYGLALLPLPESPRWLVGVGRVSAARRMLRRLGESESIVAEYAGEGRGEHSPGWSSLISRANRPILMIGLALMFLSVFSGFDMVLFYAPTVLKQAGFADDTVNYLATMGFGFVYLLMALVSLWMVDRAGRKPLIVGGLAVMTTCLIAMAAIGNVSSGQSSLVGWGMTVCLSIFVGAFALTVGPVVEVVVAEIYPQAIRGAAASVVNGARSLFAIVFSFTFPILLASLGMPVTLLYAAISLAGIVYVLRALPETKGRTLEQIAEEWPGGLAIRP